MPVPEPSSAVYYITSFAALVVLVALYFFGVWSRTYVMRSHTALPLSKQLVGAIPVGLLTMGVYAKTSFPALTQAGSDMAFEGAIMAGYAIIFGMMSRETLERLLTHTSPPTPPAP